MWKEIVECLEGLIMWLRHSIIRFKSTCCSSECGNQPDCCDDAFTPDKERSKSV